MRCLSAIFLVLVLTLISAPATWAANITWEDGESLVRGWQRYDGSVQGTADISTDFVKQGSGALRFSITPPIPTNSWIQFIAKHTFPDDWSLFGKLTFDLYNGLANNSIWLSVHVYQGTKKTTLIAYAKQAPGWNKVELEIPAGFTGVTAVILGFNCNESPGHSIYVDNMQLLEASKSAVSRSDIRLYDMQNGSFENGLQGWKQTGAVVSADSRYFGNTGVQLNSGAQMTQAIPVGNTIEVPHVGDQVEAGFWTLLPKGKETGSDSVSMVISAVSAQGAITTLARTEGPQPSTGNWTFVKTKALAPIPNGTASIVVMIQNSLAFGVLFDFVQVGTQFAVQGVPERAVIGHLLPWYSTADGGWAHWKYGEHDPIRRLANGRLDAASVFYPYIGLYSSADLDVIEYQTDLALAMGLDVIDIDWYGMQHNTWQVGVVDAFIAAAERKGLKISVRYEPKVHISNWVPHGSRAEAIDAITQDIIGLVQRWGNRAGYLHIGGLPVVGTFGMLLLTSTEWQGVYDKVIATTGDIHLMGDQAPSSSQNARTWYPMFRSTFKWSLYSASISNNLPALSKFTDSLHQAVNRWADADPANRFGISLIYPGFDDTAVNGWGSGTRVLEPKTLDFYTTTMTSADKSGLKWALVVTLNDWNEGTIVEPSITEQFGFTRANATREWVTKFKGTENTYATVEEVTRDYYERVFRNRYQ